jgi:predicted nucleic acid-binding protein
LVVCAPVYAELLAHPKAKPGFVDEFLALTDVLVDFDLDEAIWREAGRSFAAYARRLEAGARPKRLLVDFIVGAHAVRRADRLLTLDPGRYARHFPGLPLLP